MLQADKMISSAHIASPRCLEDQLLEPSQTKLYTSSLFRHFKLVKSYIFGHLHFGSPFYVCFIDFFLIFFYLGNFFHLPTCSFCFFGVYLVSRQEICFAEWKLSHIFYAKSNISVVQLILKCSIDYSDRQ